MPETISKTGMCQCGRECELKLERSEFRLDDNFMTIWTCDRCHTRRMVVLKPSVQSHLIAAVKEAGVYRPDYYQAAKQIARAIRQNPDAMLDTSNPQPINQVEETITIAVRAEIENVVHGAKSVTDMMDKFASKRKRAKKENDSITGRKFDLE